MAITAITPHLAARQFKLRGREIATTFFTLLMLHFLAVASHTLLLCFESVCHFFLVLEQAVFHSSSHAGTHLSFFFPLPQTDPRNVKHRRDGSPVLSGWHLGKVRSNEEIGASPSPSPRRLLRSANWKKYRETRPN